MPKGPFRTKNTTAAESVVFRAHANGVVLSKWRTSAFYWELRNIYHHHPESKKRKSSEANSDSIHPYGRHGNAVKTRKTISTIAILLACKGHFREEGRYGGGRYFDFPCSRCLHESPFLEPLLTTLLRTLLPIKAHCKTASKNPS